MKPLDFTRHAQDLRDTWQARALAEARGRQQAVVLAVLFHNYHAAMQVLLRVVFPKAPLAGNGWTEINRPFLIGAALIAPDGTICCDMMRRDGVIAKRAPIYRGESSLLFDMRKLADKLKLADADRREMFGAIQNWIVRDMRIDHLGRKLAS